MKAKSLTEEILPEETWKSREKIPNKEILVASKLMHSYQQKKSFVGN